MSAQRHPNPRAPRRILVFRFGSIGDFVISLPCFHLIRQVNPGAEIGLLTNLPANDRIVPAEAVLQGTGLVDRYVRYPGGTRKLHELRALKREIASFAPDLLIYLAEPRGTLSIYRDYLFFRWCGIRHFAGLAQLWLPQRSLTPIAGSYLQEAESHRLARRLSSFGNVEPDNPDGWDLLLTPAEIAEANRLVAGAFPDKLREHKRLLGFSLGTKQPIKDWGDENWRAVLSALGSFDFGLVIVGGEEDRTRSQAAAAAWSGPVLNLCGSVSPRISAAVLRQVRLFLCHDSGPMHLAAAVGTPCVAVFSRHNPPGKWFPAGRGHRVLYPMAKSATIASIRPRQLIAAAADVLGDKARRGAAAMAAD